MQGRLGWEDMRLVLAVGTAGTLAGAARALGIDHSTAFRRLGALEGRLGARLFDRARDGYAPTPAGEAVMASAARVEQEITGLERALAGQDLRPSGTVRATTTDTLVEVLTPCFAAFREAQPEIVLEVVATNAFLTLTRRDADVAIRPAVDAPEALVGRRAAGLGFAVYGAARSAPADLGDPAAHRWVAPDESLAQAATARWVRANVPDGAVVHRSNTLLGVAAAARAGMGLAVLPCFMGDADPGLARVGGVLPGVDSGLWLLTHPDLRRVARVRAFLDFMAAEIARRRPLFEGRG
jgi:DNA-binding transcriptional LysR family regulator